MDERVEPTRITLARRLAGLTKAQFAKEMGVSPGTVVAWEDGSRDPSTRLQAISKSLKQPESFFVFSEVPCTDPAGISFRKRFDATRAVRDKAAAAIDLAAGVLSPAIRGQFARFPEPDVPRLAGMSPQSAAKVLREHWGLGTSPIRNVVEQLEARGVQVFWVNESSPSLSAFCKWIDRVPFVILNTSRRDGCRSRFDAAHELGHLVCHTSEEFDLTARAKELEREADAFASAFLLPADEFLEDAPRVFDLDALFELKKDWKVSVSAMVRRLYDLGIFTAWQYEQAFRVISAKGWRSGPEPLAGNMEASSIHWALCDAIEARDIQPKDFAEMHMGVRWSTVAEHMPVLATRQEPFMLGSILKLDIQRLLESDEANAAIPFDD